MNTKKIATIGIIAFIIFGVAAVLVWLSQGVLDTKAITAWLRSSINNLSIFEFIVIICISNMVFGNK